MGDFNGNDYRKRVMSRLAVDFSVADPETGDPFFVLDLDPETATDAEVTERLSDVVAFWHKERNSVKYKGLAVALVAAAPRYEAVLCDPQRRAAAAARVRGERSAAQAERFADLDRLAGQLTNLHGGIPAAKVDQLRMLSRRRGLDDAAFAGWLARHKVLPDTAAEAMPWEAAIRRQIRSQLDELARGADQPGRYATLWTFLDLSPSCSDAELAARHAELLADNQRTRHTQAKTRAGELLAHIKTRLMAEGGRVTYAASLRADARDAIDADVAEMAIVTGEVSASDYELLVQRIIGRGWGITSREARDLVRDAATALGASLAVAPAVEYVLCGACRTPQPEPSRKAGARCRYCDVALYTTCPTCEQVVDAAAITCPHCGTSFKAQREAAELVLRGREDLNAGRPRAAQEVVSAARARLGSTRPPVGLSELATAVDAALAAAAADWAAMERDLAARRLWTAYDRAARLTRTAVDVPGPNGVSAAEKLAELAEVKASVQAEVRAAAALDPAGAETALERVLGRAVDCAEAAAALTAIPLAGPGEVTADVVDECVTIDWQPSPAPGLVSYRIVRTATFPDAPPVSATIATTAATSIEDAGAPGGGLIRYEVSAVSGRRRSAAASSPEVFVQRDVGPLHVTAEDDAIQLRWSNTPGAGLVVLERARLAVDQSTAADGAPVIEGPTRRIRPSEPGGYLDTDVQPGTTYLYRVYVEYRRPGTGPVRTPGRTATGRVALRPVPVTDLWAVTDQGRTTLSFASPPAGEVTVYASTGPHARGLAEVGAEFDEQGLARLVAAAAARSVGTGRRRVIDAAAAGRVVYTPVTRVDGRAVVGAPLDHLAIGRIEDLTAEDRGDGVSVRFALPAGVTEAFVAWRSDAAPTSPADPRASVAKVTNTKLEIGGGFLVPVPADGRGLWVAVWPAVRIAGSGQPVAGPHAGVLPVRQARAVQVCYTVRRAGLRRRTVQVDVDAYPDPLPHLVLVARAGTEPPISPGAGIVLGRVGGDGATSASLQVAPESLPADECALRLFLTERPERPTTVTDPEPGQVVVRR